MMMRYVVALFVSAVSMFHAPIHAQHLTLRNLAQKHDPAKGPFVVLLNPLVPARDLPSLLAEADLVVDGIIDRSMSELTADATSIETTLNVAVTRVLFHNLQRMSVPTDAIKRLQVIYPGGEVDVDGRAVVVVSVSRVPPLHVAGRFVLFLKKISGAPDGTFAIINGAYGVFELNRGRVFSLVISPKGNIHAHDGMDVEAFGAIIRSLQALGLD